MKETYNGFTEWESVVEFTDAIAKQLKLLPADKWKETGENSVKISCQNFYVISEISPKIGAYELQKPSLFISLNLFEDNLTKREKENKEQEKKTFKP